MLRSLSAEVKHIPIEPMYVLSTKRVLSKSKSYMVEPRGAAFVLIGLSENGGAYILQGMSSEFQERTA